MLFNDRWYQEQAGLFGRGVLHERFALFDGVGGSGEVVAKAQPDVLAGFKGVCHGRDAPGVNSLQFFDETQDAVQFVLRLGGAFSR